MPSQSLQVQHACAMLCLENTVSLMVWTTSGSYSLPTSSYMQISEPWGEHSDMYVPLELSTSVS